MERLFFMLRALCAWTARRLLVVTMAARQHDAAQLRALI